MTRGEAFRKQVEKDLDLEQGDPGLARAPR